ncbi:alpha/beta hydrolase [Phytoactinopolyspora alkaliphila]|uniref:Alpha/beta hydrolase n=1 Tax=Phytoactinopolyspora alkaliphila TaxID=1783498 RepID=A0A6N9YLG2_9ACTN|nr:alpha/beta hydrolase [Phytoactinopolyspora alkaliphila]NED95688.1 alpha/beta hydrolase [Phytoactinopolyspora alkaliphila]
MTVVTTGDAAGVPYVAVPPAEGTDHASAPVVVAWHLMDPPRTEAAFAAALPLDGLDAWRIYLGLPMSGSRLPEGGFEEVMRLGYEDAVLNLHGPVVTQAAEEFPAALAVLRSRLGLGDARLGVVGGSAGAAVAALVIAESEIAVDAAVLVSPLLRLVPAVEAMGRQHGVTYPWSDASRAVAHRLDFVARAGELAAAGEPATLVVVGENDDEDGFLVPAREFRDELAGRYSDARRAQLVVVPGMAHALAEEPGIEAAPQTPHAAEVDRHAARWLERHLH